MGMTPEQIKKTQTPAVIMLFMFFFLVFILNVIDSSSSYGRIYFIVSIVALMLYIFSLLSPNMAEVSLISTVKPLYQVIAGFILGIILAARVLLGNAAKSFSFLSPLSVPQIQKSLLTIQFGTIPSIFLMSMAVSEFEESFRAGTLMPTLKEWLSNPRISAVVLTSLSILVYFLIDFIKPVALGLTIYGILSILNPDYIKPVIENKWFSTIVAILGAASVFAVLHATAYGFTGALTVTQRQQAVSLMANAFLYAIIADAINNYFKSSTASKIAHTINNAALMCVAMGVTPFFSLFVGAVHALVLYAMSESIIKGGIFHA